ncbi:MAG: hypothetical protein H6825_11385 [Planctomycetes bacterium]|nr:hypothetical protein [Planctomycetota bacterium]
MLCESLLLIACAVPSDARSDALLKQAEALAAAAAVDADPVAAVLHVEWPVDVVLNEDRVDSMPSWGLQSWERNEIHITGEPDPVDASCPATRIAKRQQIGGVPEQELPSVLTMHPSDVRLHPNGNMLTLDAGFELDALTKHVGIDDAGAVDALRIDLPDEPIGIGSTWTHEDESGRHFYELTGAYEIGRRVVYEISFVRVIRSEVLIHQEAIRGEHVDLDVAGQSGAPAPKTLAPGGGIPSVGEGDGVLHGEPRDRAIGYRVRTEGTILVSTDGVAPFAWSVGESTWAWEVPVLPAGAPPLELQFQTTEATVVRAPGDTLFAEIDS